MSQERSGGEVEGVDGAVTEVADKQSSRKRSERRGSNGHSPGCVQRSLRSNAADEGTVGIKQADKSGPGGKYGIMLEGILLREGHNHLVVRNDVNSKRGKACGKCWVQEGAPKSAVGLNPALYASLSPELKLAARMKLPESFSTRASPL